MPVQVGTAGLLKGVGMKYKVSTKIELIIEADSPEQALDIYRLLIKDGLYKWKESEALVKETEG